MYIPQAPTVISASVTARRAAAYGVSVCGFNTGQATRYGAVLFRDEGDCVDLDQGALQQPRNLDGRARREARTEALAAHARVFGVLVQARQPGGDANDVLERAADGPKRRLDLIEAPVRLLGHRAAGREVSRYVHRSSRSTDRHRLAESGAARARNALYAHGLSCSVAAQS